MTKNVTKIFEINHLVHLQNFTSDFFIQYIVTMLKNNKRPVGSKRKSS